MTTGADRDKRHRQGQRVLQNGWVIKAEACFRCVHMGHHSRLIFDLGSPLFAKLSVSGWIQSRLSPTGSLVIQRTPSRRLCLILVKHSFAKKHA